MSNSMASAIAPEATTVELASTHLNEAFRMTYAQAGQGNLGGGVLAATQLLASLASEAVFWVFRYHVSQRGLRQICATLQSV